MNDLTTESPIFTNSQSSSDSSTNTNSSSPCISSSSNFSFSTVDDILKIYPSSMKNVLKTYKVKNCSLKNGYCSDSIDNSSGCLFDTPDSMDSQCSCDCLLFPLNLMSSMDTTINCILTNTSNTNYVISDQTIIFSLMEDGENLSNANINTSQTANVKCVSLSSNNVQQGIADLSYQVILNIIEQSKTEPSLFLCPISQDFLKMYEEYGKDDLNNIVQSSVKSTISSFVQDNQTINISLSQIEFKQLSANITQSDALRIVTKNIVSQSFNKINQSVLGEKFNDIMESFNNYCFPQYTEIPTMNTKSLSNNTKNNGDTTTPLKEKPIDIKKLLVILLPSLVISCAIIGSLVARYHIIS